MMRSGGCSRAFIRTIASAGSGSSARSIWRGRSPLQSRPVTWSKTFLPFWREVPDDARLVVFHSAVLTYVTADRRQAFARILADVSRSRDVVWLSNEPPGVIPEMTVMAPPQNELRYLLGRTTLIGGRRRDELLALAHPHGAELAWL